MKRLLGLSIGLGMVLGCSSAPQIHGDKTIVAQGGSRPGWVSDTNEQTQKKLAEAVGHEAGDYRYVVASATVDAGEQNLPTCYEFAAANASHEIAAELYTEIKGSTATASDESSRAQYSESIKSIQGRVVGLQILAKHWETTQSKDKEEKTSCSVITGIPMKNYTNLKKYAEQKLKDNSASPVVKRAKKAVQKKQDTKQEDEESAEE